VNATTWSKAKWILAKTQISNLEIASNRWARAKFEKSFVRGVCKEKSNFAYKAMWRRMDPSKRSVWNARNFQWWENFFPSFMFHKKNKCELNWNFEKQKWG